MRTKTKPQKTQSTSGIGVKLNGAANDRPGGTMYKRCSVLKNVETKTSGGTSPVDSLVMPVTLHDLFLWHEKLKAKNGYMVLSKQDRRIIDILV